MKISNRRLHYFNPGHEEAIRTGQPHYTPPASVCKMMADLAFLPAWYGNDGDYVIMNETGETFRFLLSLPEGVRPGVIPIRQSDFAQLSLTNLPPPPPEGDMGILSPFGGGRGRLSLQRQKTHQYSQIYIASPWGMSPDSVGGFEKLRTMGTLGTLGTYGKGLVIPAWKEIYKRLTGRQTAAECLAKIRTLMPEDFGGLRLPRFCKSLDEIRRYMEEYPPPYILKMPYSCSGRGIYRIQARSLALQDSRWVEGALKKQGEISIEQELEKICDFAMEFESDGNGFVGFKGFSVFETSSKGEYSGNLLGSQQMIKNHIIAFIPASHLQEIKKAVTSILTEVFGFEYRGYLGVDMLIYKCNNGFAVHPFIEINMRNTMGLVALQLSNRLVHPSAKGKLYITCDKEKNKAFDTHLHMQEQYPLQLSGSKIRSGYLSLCPVTPETQFRAYVLIMGDPQSSG